MDEIYRAEQRLGEVAGLTPGKAPELLATYNQAWLDAQRYVVGLTHELDVAKAEANTRQATMVVDEIPAILEQKKLPNTVDVRKALIELDPTHKDLRERAAKIEAVIALLETKSKAFENAFTSIKRLISMNSYNYGAGRTNDAAPPKQNDTSRIFGETE
jgi:hypothetical protein